MSTAPVLTERRKPGRPPRVPHSFADMSPKEMSGMREETRRFSPSLSDFLATPPIKQRLRYREQLTKTQALEELAKLRAIAQLAAEEINQRLQPEEDECMQCGKIMPSGGKPIQMVIVRDAATGTAQTKVLCSIECVRQYNRGKMGLSPSDHPGIGGEIK